MSVSMEKAMKNMEKTSQWLEKERIKEENRVRGHEPKCKVCNSEYQVTLDNMKEDYKTYREMKEFLENQGESISQMALSRHFSNHYPKRKAYLDNIKTMEDESIKEAIESYPFLKSIFQETRRELDYDNMVLDEEQTGFKENIFLERTLSDIFLHDNGYCLEEYRFCSRVPKKQTEYMDEIIGSIDEKIRSLDKYSFNESKKIDLLNQKIECYECRNSTNNLRMEYMMHLLLKNIFKIEVESDKLNEFLNLTFDKLLFSDEVDYDFNKMDKLLANFKE
jgi:hypothetical protein